MSYACLYAYNNEYFAWIRYVTRRRQMHRWLTHCIIMGKTHRHLLLFLIHWWYWRDGQAHCIKGSLLPLAFYEASTRSCSKLTALLVPPHQLACHGIVDSVPPTCRKQQKRYIFSMSLFTKAFEEKDGLLRMCNIYVFTDPLSSKRAKVKRENTGSFETIPVIPSF